MGVANAQLKGERGLLAAITYRARLDLEYRGTQPEGILARADALQWVRSDADYPMSFRYTCRVFGFDVERRRQMLLRAIINS